MLSFPGFQCKQWESYLHTFTLVENLTDALRHLNAIWDATPMSNQRCFGYDTAHLAIEITPKREILYQTMKYQENLFK